MGDISDDLKGLRESLKSGRQTLTADIRSISDQFQKIMNLLFDEIDDLRDGADKDLDDIFIDVSDEEINRTKQGKIASSHNYGEVEGDRNAGGIAGAMSIDLAIDPEDDIAHPKTLSFTYRMKVILQASAAWSAMRKAVRYIVVKTTQRRKAQQAIMSAALQASARARFAAAMPRAA